LFSFQCFHFKILRKIKNVYHWATYTFTVNNQNKYWAWAPCVRARNEMDWNPVPTRTTYSFNVLTAILNHVTLNHSCFIYSISAQDDSEKRHFNDHHHYYYGGNEILYTPNKPFHW
jgi:hypothetical protein